MNAMQGPNLRMWLMAAGVLAASVATAQERPAAAIALDTYLQRRPGTADGQGAVRLDSAGSAAGSRISGSWSGSTAAPAMFRRGVTYQTAQIVPIGAGVTPASRTHRVSWQYSFLGAPPAAARAYLCNYARCVTLDGASGSTTAFAGDSGWSNFSFAFVIDGGGALTPALQGSGSQVIVNYE
jgi:hypothetical protein